MHFNCREEWRKIAIKEVKLANWCNFHGFSKNPLDWLIVNCVWYASVHRKSGLMQSLVKFLLCAHCTLHIITFDCCSACSAIFCANFPHFFFRQILTLLIQPWFWLVSALSFFFSVHYHPFHEQAKRGCTYFSPNDICLYSTFNVKYYFLHP